MLRKTFFFFFFQLMIGLVYGQQVQHVETFQALKPMLEKPSGDTLFVYNFWATWCRPCVKELPYFQKLDSVYADKKVKVVLISIDDPEMIEPMVKPFVKRRKITQPVYVLTDPKQNDWIPQISEEWSGAIPATLIMNNEEGIVSFKEQSFTYEELSEWVDEVLKNRPKK
ncbi:MAG: TlpA disulfide reductase family protein [Bacteroidota bacterium]